MSRPIDATALVKLVLEERDKIPLEVVERYSFGVPSPNKHGQSMRGGIRKVLRLIEQAPTLDYAPVRHGEWIKYDEANPLPLDWRYRCSLCGCPTDYAHNPTNPITQYCKDRAFIIKSWNRRASDENA